VWPRPGLGLRRLETFDGCLAVNFRLEIDQNQVEKMKVKLGKLAVGK